MFVTQIGSNIVLSASNDTFILCIKDEVEFVSKLDTEEYLCIETVLAAIAWPPTGGYRWRYRREQPLQIDVEYLAAASSLGSNWTAYVRGDAGSEATVWLDFIREDWKVVRVQLNQREARASIEAILGYVRDGGGRGLTH